MKDKVVGRNPKDIPKLKEGRNLRHQNRVSRNVQQGGQRGASTGGGVHPQKWHPPGARAVSDARDSLAASLYAGIKCLFTGLVCCYGCKCRTLNNETVDKRNVIFQNRPVLSDLSSSILTLRTFYHGTKARLFVPLLQMQA